MPAFITPTYPPLRSRSENATDNNHTTPQHDPKPAIIASTIIGIIALSWLGAWAYIRITAWRKTTLQARLAREKALQDQRAWYGSVRPVLRSPQHLPHILAAPIGARTNQGAEVLWQNDEALTPGERYASDLDEMSLESARMAARRSLRMPAVRESKRDVGRSEVQPVRLSGQTVSTVCTLDSTVSMGVAVPMTVPPSRCAVRIDFSAS